MKYLLNGAKMVAQGIEIEAVYWMESNNNHATVYNKQGTLFDGYAYDPAARNAYEKELARLTEIANGKYGAICGAEIVTIK